MAEVSFYSIPGNIKQSLLPFQINPLGYINQVEYNSEEIKLSVAKEVTNHNSNNMVATKYPQVFSFKTTLINKTTGNAIGLKGNEGLTNNANGLGKISFIPKTYEQYFNYDISHKLLYTRDGQDLTYADMLDNIPSIQVREFLPDTKLDQLMDAIAGLMDVLKKLISGIFSSDSNQNEEQKAAAKTGFITKLKNILVYLTGTIDPSLISDIISLYKADENNEELNIIASGKANDYVVKLVYLLYCKLQSFVTTNIYELPGEIEGSTMYRSPNGKAGWTSGKSAGQISISDMGGFLAKFIPNVTINYMPFWDAKDVAKADPEIKLKLSLVNDNVDGAIHNFIFVNTLVPNNRFLQYNIFQHSPCLYDVKIDGYDRLFACAANIDVKYQGTLRNPSEEFYEKLKIHVNTQLIEKGKIEDFIKSLKNNKLIKIPDTYEVEMSFQSILPLSYNRMLFNYLLNFNQLDSPRMYQHSLFNTAIKTISNSVTQIWSGEKQITKLAEQASIVGSLGNAINNILG